MKAACRQKLPGKAMQSVSKICENSCLENDTLPEVVPEHLALSQFRSSDFFISVKQNARSSIIQIGTSVVSIQKGECLMPSR